MEVKKLDGSYMQVEEVNGMWCEVEKKELIGGVFEDGETVHLTTHFGKTYPVPAEKGIEYAIQRGLVWKTQEEAERKVEIDKLIAKYRITDREVIEDVGAEKYELYANTAEHIVDLYGCINSVTGAVFTKENATKLIELITYDELFKYVLLVR